LLELTDRTLPDSVSLEAAVVAVGATETVEPVVSGKPAEPVAVKTEAVAGTKAPETLTEGATDGVEDEEVTALPASPTPKVPVVVEAVVVSGFVTVTSSVAVAA